MWLYWLRVRIPSFTLIKKPNWLLRHNNVFKALLFFGSVNLVLIEHIAVVVNKIVPKLNYILQEGLLIDWLQKKSANNFIKSYILYSNSLWGESFLYKYFIKSFHANIIKPLSVYVFKNHNNVESIFFFIGIGMTGLGSMFTFYVGF